MAFVRLLTKEFDFKQEHNQRSTNKQREKNSRKKLREQ